MSETIDGKTLAALHYMSRDTVDGVVYMDFVKLGLMEGVLNLMDRGHSERVGIADEGIHYRLTPQGQDYWAKVLRYAQEQF